MIKNLGKGAIYVSIKLEQLVQDFDEGLHYFYTNDKAPFSRFRRGPCLHFHKRTVGKLKELLDQYDSYDKVCSNPKYVELLYATLTAWGMNRAGGPELQGFDGFFTSFKNYELIRPLESLKRATLVGIDKISDVKNDVQNMYIYLASNHRVMRTDRAITGVSKTLHHMLPHLLVPVDKEHIIFLLGNLEKEEYRPDPRQNKYDSFENYWKCIRISHHIAKGLAKRGIQEPSEWGPRDSTFQIQKRLMDTSIPKMIDNALIGLSEVYQRKGLIKMKRKKKLSSVIPV